jgi:hypothetical protein
VDVEGYEYAKGLGREWEKAEVRDVVEWWTGGWHPLIFQETAIMLRTAACLEFLYLGSTLVGHIRW